MSKTFLVLKEEHSYSTLCGLSKVSFKVQENELVGLVGPRRSGKSCLAKLLTNELLPTEGGFSLRGLAVLQNQQSQQKLLNQSEYVMFDEIAQNIGIVLDDKLLIQSSTVEENVKFFVRCKYPREKKFKNGK